MNKVEPFPYFKLEDVPESLRLLAHKIERRGDGYKAERIVVLIEMEDGSLDYKAFGKDFTRAHAVGLCAVGMRRIMD